MKWKHPHFEFTISFEFSMMMIFTFLRERYVFEQAFL